MPWQDSSSGYTTLPLFIYKLLTVEQAEGFTCLHGTSHGVGSYLNVHEGPIGIGP